MFLLDASSSINYPNASGEGEESTRYFEEMVLPFANRLAWRQILGPQLNESRVGLATFASSATMPIAMNAHFDPFTLEQDILATPYMTGVTRLSMGLDLVRTQMLDVANGIRGPERGVRRVLVVLTDGEANAGFEPDGRDELLRDEGVEIFVVGITESVNITKLEAMASEPASSHTFYIEQFEELAGVVGEVSDDVCASLRSQSSCGDDIAQPAYCQAQRAEGLCSNAEVYRTCRGSCCGFTSSPTNGPSEPPTYSEPTRAPTKRPTDALDPCQVLNQCYIQQNVACCEGGAPSRISEDFALMMVRLAQRALDDLGNLATSRDVTCIADTIARCADPRCYAGCERPGTQTTAYGEGLDCAGNIERASELTVLVSSILDLDQSVLESSESSSQLRGLLISTVSMTECRCSDATDRVETCVTLENVAVMTTCALSTVPYSSAGADGEGEGCGLIGGSRITYSLPAPRFIQDNPGTYALVQTIVYGHDALFFTEVQSATNRTVATTPIDITVARARSTGRFARSAAGQLQEVELAFPVMIDGTIGHWPGSLDTDVRSCEYFLDSDNRWDATGCRLIADRSNATVTVCRCNHLTTFAVLTDTEDIEASIMVTATDDCGINAWLYIAVCLSILLLALKMVYILCKNTGRSPANWMVFWISFMMAVSFCLMLAALTKPSGDTGKVVGLALHFTMLCSVFWMLCLAAHMYRTLVHLDTVSLKKTAMDRRHSFLEDQRQGNMSLGQRRNSATSLGSSRAVIPTREEVRHDRRQLTLRYAGFAFCVPAIIVAITSSMWYSSYNEASAHSAWLSVAAVWGFAAAALCAFITSIILVIAARHYLYCMNIRLESMGGVMNPTAFAEVDAIIAVMKFFKVQIWMTFTIVIMMLVVWIFGTLILLFCCELWTIVFAAAIVVTSFYILWLAYDIDEVIINPLEWAEMREAGMALGNRSYIIQNRMRQGSQSLRTGSTITDGYISSLGPNDDYLAIGGSGGMNLMDGGSVPMSSMGLPMGHVHPVSTPKLIEVFRLFDVISARFRDNADLIPQDESITQNLLVELQAQIGPDADATRILAALDAQGRHLVGVLTFLATVEAFIEYRLPGEGTWSVNAVELLRIFSSLNGLDHDGMTGAELSRMFSADALRRKLTARVSLCDPANTVEEVTEYIMRALPEAADGCISMWEFFNAMQGILQVR